MAEQIVSYGDLVLLLGKKDVALLERDKIIEALQGELQELNGVVENLKKEVENVNSRRNRKG